MKKRSPDSVDELKVRVQAISLIKKEKILKEMSEDEFRDSVVRPILYRRGFRDGRDLCGPTEHGKDALFVTTNPLGQDEYYGLQTKIGNLNLASKVTHNVVEIITQVKTALTTTYSLTAERKKILLNNVIVCTSGTINDAARKHIVEEVRDNRITFLDKDDVIPWIDNHLPEFWININSTTFPYLRSLKSKIEESSEIFSAIGLIPESEGIMASAATEEMFVNLNIYRRTLKPVKSHGKVHQVPDFEEFPLKNILTRSEKLILLKASAGSGKTTSLLRLAYILIEKGLQGKEENPIIPVFLRFADIIHNPKKLYELCIDSTKQISGLPEASIDKKDLKNGNVAILIDGLDEVNSKEDISKRLQNILEFHAEFPKIQVILTSRDYKYLNELNEISKFNNFYLSPINTNQVKKIFDRLAKKKSLPVETSKEILRRIEQIHGMELNPLLVTVFAATSDYSRKDIPANITELFKKFTEMMLGRWDAAKGLSNQYQAPLKDFILQLIAYKMHKEKESRISIKQISDIIKEELKSRGHESDVELLLEEILYRSGLFRFPEESYVEFRHLLLQEFFAGRGIKSEKELLDHITDEWWQRAIVFYFGENPDNFDELVSIIDMLGEANVNPLQVYQASITLGLSLQACYLVKVIDKALIFDNVINGISVGYNIFSKKTNSQTPISQFIGYFLASRDSLACSNVLKDDKYLGELTQKLNRDNSESEEKDIYEFCLIIGLIESGLLSLAEERMETFHPKDLKLLLAIHLGCFLTHHVRSVSTENKKISKRICDTVAEDILPLRKQVLEEFKSELIEMRNGKMKELPVPSLKD